MNTKGNHLITYDDLGKANKLMTQVRFGTQDCALECREALESLVIENTSDRVIVDPQKVCLIFSRLYTKKSTGPDGISALLLKSCAEELTVAWCPIFQQSVDSHIIPDLWKKSIIVPLPKRKNRFE